MSFAKSGARHFWLSHPAFQIAFWMAVLGASSSVSATVAKAETLWALKPLAVPTLPAVTNRTWALTPIDYFVLASLEQNQLEPSPAADRTTLLRRATLDLHGLPPAPSEIDEFLADGRPDAFARVVERLLASPRYGERWGRHWLDLARFAESDGFEYDKMREHSWPYRDYVIRSFNADLPYAQFVREQIAGDACHPQTRLAMAATGFLIAGAYDEAGNSSKSDLLRARIREEELEDVIAGVSQTFLGLTVNCARCHDHKFDPISQRDYYRLKAVFTGIGRGTRPWATDLEIQDGQNQTRHIPDEKGGPTNRLMVYTVISKPAPPTFVLSRGDVERPEAAVTAGGLSAVKEVPANFGLSSESEESQRRLKWAEWVVHPANPLPARVLVNRIWQHHFGRGLAPAPNDFGANGGRPSHPELLDYLATEFVRSGGSVKALHRSIMLSRVYQQAGIASNQSASRGPSRAPDIDADNRLLWHFPMLRLEAEAIRDAMLSVSAQLNDQMFGPSFRPFTVTVSGSHFYQLADMAGASFNRRTIYRMNIQSAKEPLLDALDCPDPATKTPVRSVTTTPIQALGLMNSSFVQRQAHELARRLERETKGGIKGQIELGYRLAFGRPPDAAESSHAAELVATQDLPTFCWVLLNASEFIYVR